MACVELFGVDGPEESPEARCPRCRGGCLESRIRSVCLSIGTASGGGGAAVVVVVVVAAGIVAFPPTGSLAGDKFPYTIG